MSTQRLVAAALAAALVSIGCGSSDSGSSSSAGGDGGASGSSGKGSAGKGSSGKGGSSTGGKGGSSMACVPGKTSDCSCVGSSAPGVQSCKADGSGFDACICAAAGGAGGGAGGALPGGSGGDVAGGAPTVGGAPGVGGAGGDPALGPGGAGGAPVAGSGGAPVAGAGGSGGDPAGGAGGSVHTKGDPCSPNAPSTCPPNLPKCGIVDGQFHCTESGPIPHGGPCMLAFTGDDCLAGDLCDFADNTCHTLCVNDGGCPGTEICDITQTLPNGQAVDICEGNHDCNPITQDCTEPGKACYVGTVNAQCQPEGSGELGSPCATQGACKKGMSCVALHPPAFVCTQVCDLNAPACPGGLTCQMKPASDKYPFCD